MTILQTIAIGLLVVCSFLILSWAFGLFCHVAAFPFQWTDFASGEVHLNCLLIGVAFFAVAIFFYLAGLFGLHVWALR